MAMPALEPDRWIADLLGGSQVDPDGDVLSGSQW